MKEELALKIEGVSKQYRLGEIGTGTITHDINRWFYKLRGKDDPYTKIGDVNDRTKEGGDYVWALNNIDLEVKQGEILGIIGKNGAGKSTLLKLFSRITGPTTGKIFVNGRMASLLEVGTGFHPELTGRENIFLNGAILGMSKKEIQNKLNDIIDFSGCAKYVDTPVKRYSSGMRVRLGFAVAAFLEPDILVVDEVLAVGDAEFQKQAIGKMKDVSSSKGRTVLFVSHNMNSILNLCTRVIVMDQGQIAFSGDVSKGIEYYLEKRDDLIGVREYDKSKHRPVTEMVELEKITLTNLIGEVIDTFSLYEEVYVKIEYDVKHVKEDLYPNIHVFDNQENYFFADSVSEDDIPRSIGSHETIFKIPKNTFNVGIYSINVAMTSYPGTNVHFNVKQALVFEVLEEDLSHRKNPVTLPWPGVTRIKLSSKTKIRN